MHANKKHLSRIGHTDTITYTDYVGMRACVYGLLAASWQAEGIWGWAACSSGRSDGCAGKRRTGTPPLWKRRDTRGEYVLLHRITARVSALDTIRICDSNPVWSCCRTWPCGPHSICRSLSEPCCSHPSGWSCQWPGWEACRGVAYWSGEENIGFLC